MSSFDNFYTRLQSLNEARKSPVEALVPGATGVTKQMRSAGLSSAPLDTIRIIRELLFNLDVISEDQLNSIKSGKGFTGKKQAMLKVLQNNQDVINAKSDEIAQKIESTLDDFISGMGANRSREEKYAAQAAAQELAAQARAAKSGKEMDDALADVISDEKLIIKASLAKAIQELEDLPGGEDISPNVLAEIKKFAPKINTLEQFESFVKQLSGMEEYQLPAAYLSSTVKAIKGGMEDIEMEDQEDPDHGFDAVKSDLDGDGNISKYERNRGEAIASAMSKEDNEYGEAETVGFEELGLNYALASMLHEDEYDHNIAGKSLDIRSLKNMIANKLAKNPDIGIRSHLNKMEKQLSGYDDAVVVSFVKSKVGEDAEGPEHGSVEEHYPEDKDPRQPLETGEDEDGEQAGHPAGSGEVEARNARYHELQMARAKAGIKDEDEDEDEDDKEEEEEIVAESKYTTADYLTDIYSTVEPIIESTVNENGQTTPTQQYLVEKHEEAIEEVYTNQYLVEQKVQDSLPKQKKESNLSFKERFQPKTHWQLEEVRRYGL